LKATLEEHRSLDVLVNCAGIGVARKTYNIHKNKPHPLEEFEKVLLVSCHGHQSSRKPTGPKTEASEFEVGPVKFENQEVRLAFGFYQIFMIYFRGPVKIIGGQSVQTIHWSYWPAASLDSFREDWVNHIMDVFCW
jgi:hypothetical protein